jgi:predicted nucleic acid-binding Zn ribbon protein
MSMHDYVKTKVYMILRTYARDRRHVLAYHRVRRRGVTMMMMVVVMMMTVVVV